MSELLVLHNGGKNQLGDSEVLKFERVNEEHQYKIQPHLFESEQQFKEYKQGRAWMKWLEPAEIKDKWKHKPVMNHRGE